MSDELADALDALAVVLERGNGALADLVDALRGLK